MTGWVCPNDPGCEHAAAVHDVYDVDDPYPACCAEGCRCGHPGDAVCVRADDGTVTVRRADPLILVANDLLTSKYLEPWFTTDGGETIQLDTAGDYRYRYVRPGRPGSQTMVYARMGADEDTERGE